MSKNTIVRINLFNDKWYTPYCGNVTKCSMPRTTFDGEQFVCPECGWKSSFPSEFIQKYKAKWGL
jgi:predicted RNA-binding Zn-ribbon protein involved in translation (DUF1610 family)